MNSIPHQVKKRPISDPHPTSSVKDATSGDVVKVHQDQLTSSIEHTQFFNYQPQGSQVVLQNTPAQLDFIVSSSALAEIKFVALQIPITNGATGGGAALELVPAPWFFNQVQILINNQIVEQMWPEGIFSDYKYLTDEQVSLLAAMSGNMNADTLTARDKAGANPNTIAGATTKEIWLLLPATFLQQTKCPLNSIVSLANNTVTFRFYFNTFGQVTASTNTQTTVTNLQVGNMLLWLGGTSVGKNDTIPFDVNHSYTFRQHERAITPLGSLSAASGGGRISQTLVNFNGLFSQVMAYPRQQGATQEQVYQSYYSAGTTGASGPYLPAEWKVYNSTLYDSSNQPYSAVNLPYNLQALAPDFIYDNTNVRSRASTFPTKFPYMEWNLDGEPWESHYDGRLGGLPLNNNWQIVTYINPSFTTKNVELVVLGDRLTELKVDIAKGIVVGVPLQ